MSDTVSRHFMSVLSHIERAAGEAGTTVTVHDASKPAHVRLSRGVLVSQARKAQAGHGSGRGNYAVVNADGGPGAANMVGCILQRIMLPTFCSFQVYYYCSYDCTGSISQSLCQGKRRSRNPYKNDTTNTFEVHSTLCLAERPIFPPDATSMYPVLRPSKERIPLAP